MFYRLIKPMWGREKIFKNGQWSKNPDLLKSIKGPDIYEGCFDSEIIEEKNLEGFNTYWFPNHPSTNVYDEDTKYLSGKLIDIFEWVFVDMDLKDKVYENKEKFYEKLKEFSLKPNMVVDSGNGVHAYWRVTDLTRETYLSLQFGLINHFKTDSSIWTVLQLMRVPGSLNTKDSKNFKLVTVKEDLHGENFYTSDQLSELLEIEPEQLEKAQNHLNKLDGITSINLGEDVNLDELPDNFLQLLYSNERIYQLFKNPTEYYGDRSGADMSLANILYNEGLNIKEAVAVVSNTQKGLSKGLYRKDYAVNTVEKVYLKKQKGKDIFKSVGEKLRLGEYKNFEMDLVGGPDYFDCLEHKWAKTRMLGLIAGSGIGKTSATLEIFRAMVENNRDNDDIFIFFSLEMPEKEIAQKWERLTGGDYKYADRLFVVGNEDDEGEPRNISLQDIVWFSEDIMKQTGKKIASIAIDHIQIVNNVVDITKSPSFTAEGEMDGGNKDRRRLSVHGLCKGLKDVAKILDTFLIILTQTTKAKGVGDIPLGKDACYGASGYEWLVDYIITLWQPLMRVYKDTNLRVTGWQYVKIRHSSKNDRMRTYDQRVLHFDQDTERMRPLTEQEQEEFESLLPLAEELRKKVEEKKDSGYKNSLTMKKLALVLGKGK